MVHLFRAGEFKPTNQGNETRPGADSKVSLKNVCDTFVTSSLVLMVTLGIPDMITWYNMVFET